MRPGQVWRRNNSRSFNQCSKIPRCAFKSKPSIAGFERDDRVHLLANLENQIISPLNFLSCVRERQAVFANPIDVHTERLAPDCLKVEPGESVYKWRREVFRGRVKAALQVLLRTPGAHRAALASLQAFLFSIQTIRDPAALDAR